MFPTTTGAEGSTSIEDTNTSPQPQDQMTEQEVNEAAENGTESVTKTTVPEVSSSAEETHSAEELFAKQTITIVIQLLPTEEINSNSKADTSSGDAEINHNTNLIDLSASSEEPEGQQIGGKVAANERKILIGVRNDSDQPIFKVCDDEELLLTLQENVVLAELLDELKAQLPERWKKTQALKASRVTTSTTPIVNNATTSKSGNKKTKNQQKPTAVGATAQQTAAVPPAVAPSAATIERAKQQAEKIKQQKVEGVQQMSLF